MCVCGINDVMMKCTKESHWECNRLLTSNCLWFGLPKWKQMDCFWSASLAMNFYSRIRLITSSDSRTDEKGGRHFYLCHNSSKSVGMVLLFTPSVHPTVVQTEKSQKLLDICCHFIQTFTVPRGGILMTWCLLFCQQSRGWQYTVYEGNITKTTVRICVRVRVDIWYKYSYSSED